MSEISSGSSKVRLRPAESGIVTFLRARKGVFFDEAEENGLGMHIDVGMEDVERSFDEIVDVDAVVEANDVVVDIDVVVDVVCVIDAFSGN